jgi:hypothetical protein
MIRHPYRGAAAFTRASRATCRRLPKIGRTLLNRMA